MKFSVSFMKDDTIIMIKKKGIKINNKLKLQITHEVNIISL